MANNRTKSKFKSIPTQIGEKQFNLFVLPHLSKGSRGPRSKLSFYKMFNYILKLLHTGMQWHCLPIDKDYSGKAEVHYTSIYRNFRRWVKDNSLLNVFGSSVKQLAQSNLLNTSILHGDGTTTAAKKGGDIIGYSGHKHQIGEKIVAIVDQTCCLIRISQNVMMIFASLLNSFFIRS